MKSFELFCIENDFTILQISQFIYYLFRTLQFLEIIYFYTTGKIKFPCAALFYEMLF